MTSHVARAGVTLPVSDLAAARSFFTQLGWAVDEDASDPETLAFRVTPTFEVRLTDAERFRAITRREVADPAAAQETVTTLVMDSRLAVDALVERAIGAGAAEQREPRDAGVIYARAFTDPDGHVWEIVWSTDDAA